ncbi:hypothetical protein F4677DRAFT_26018 [Hypoxylon crocopeplum]|nr:hypothetical protein F4677DRAFT_26018 [Hypoxylon crocopeplum]
MNLECMLMRDATIRDGLKWPGGCHMLDIECETLKMRTKTLRYVYLPSTGTSHIISLFSPFDYDSTTLGGVSWSASGSMCNMCRSEMFIFVGRITTFTRASPMTRSGGDPLLISSRIFGNGLETLQRPSRHEKRVDGQTEARHFSRCSKVPLHGVLDGRRNLIYRPMRPRPSPILIGLWVISALPGNARLPVLLRTPTTTAQSYVNDAYLD